VGLWRGVTRESITKIGPACPTLNAGKEERKRKKEEGKKKKEEEIA
jgi:hypothetical protein